MQKKCHFNAGSRMLLTTLILAMVPIAGHSQSQVPTSSRSHNLLKVSTTQAVSNAPMSPKFVVYDNIFYRGRPAATPAGMNPLNIIYEGRIWPNGESKSTLPARKDFDALVRKATKPGPIVLDIETVRLNSVQNEIELATLVDWVHEDRPGTVVGYYGTNTLTKVKPENLLYAKQLAAHVDAMFPPMYTYNTDQAAWASRARMEADEARELAPGKPVYFYLQPQYHHKTPLEYQYVDAEYWTFQLQTARHVADGVVIWSSSNWDWNDATGWWKATQVFLQDLRTTATSEPPKG